MAPAHGRRAFAARFAAVLLDRRILFFGGKGGVGKTTCASAVALAASRAGKKVLLVSTDPAHSTSDIFGVAIKASVSEIQPSLFALEIDPAAEAKQYVGDVRSRAEALFGDAAARAVKQIELAGSMPGIEDAALFDRLSRIVADETGRYDLVVFDTAPTGHTMPLLRMPEAMAGWLKALTHSRRAMLPESQRESDKIILTLDERINRLQAFRARVTSSETTAFVLVVIPERLPIDETARAVEQLTATGVAVAAIVVNQVVPDSARGDFIEARRAQEQVHLARIDQLFAGYPRIRIAQRTSDVHGLADLEAIAAALLGSSPASTRPGT